MCVLIVYKCGHLWGVHVECVPVGGVCGGAGVCTDVEEPVCAAAMPRIRVQPLTFKCAKEIRLF